MYNVPSRGYEVNGAKYKKQEPKERLDSFAACLPLGRLGAFASKKKQEARGKRQEARAKERVGSFAALRLCEKKEERAEIPAAAGKREAR